MKTRYVSDDGKERPYRCDVCSRCYTSAGNLTVHKRSHLTTKRFACPICHKGFTRKLSRNQHIENQHLKRQSVDAEPMLQPLKDTDKHRRNSTGSWELTVALETLRMGAQRGRRARKPSLEVDVLSQAAKDHCQQRQGPILKRFECPEPGCGKKFSAKRSLIRHTQTSHVVARRRDSIAVLSGHHAQPSHPEDYNPFKIVVTAPGPKEALEDGPGVVDNSEGSFPSEAAGSSTCLPIFRDLPVPPGSTSGAFRPRPRSNSTPDALGLGLFRRRVHNGPEADQKSKNPFKQTNCSQAANDSGPLETLVAAAGAATTATVAAAASATVPSDIQARPHLGPGASSSGLISPMPILGVVSDATDRVKALHRPRAAHRSPCAGAPRTDRSPPQSLDPLGDQEHHACLSQPVPSSQTHRSAVPERSCDPAAASATPRACAEGAAPCAPASSPPISLARVNYCSVKMDELLHPHWLHPPRGPGDVSDTDSVGSECSLSQSDSPRHGDPTFNIPAVSSMRISSPEEQRCSTEEAPLPQYHASPGPSNRSAAWIAPPSLAAVHDPASGRQELSTSLFGRVDAALPCADGYDPRVGFVQSLLLRPWPEELLAPTPSHPLRDASQDPMLPVSP